MDLDELWQLLRLLRRMFSNPLHQLVIVIVMLLAFGSGAISWLIDQFQPNWVSSFLQGFSTNMFGALLIFILINIFWGEGKELQQLYDELGSSNNSIALGAIEKARLRGMLSDGSLIRSAFYGANWAKADLQGAMLRGAALIHANLKGANLRDANIEGVDFSYAQFDKHTILPDGSHWATIEDLDRFK